MFEKSKVIGTINELPDHFTIDELLERLIFMIKVEECLQNVKNGLVLNEEEARIRFSKWLK
jgi:hypothetical protein